MKNVTFNNGYSKPEAYICKQKQRVKQHNFERNTTGEKTSGTVYLKDGDEFTIELFNPTQEKLLAVIELNGKQSGSGIVLRPGERVFLDRYIDEPRKFLFDIYEVNSSDKTAVKATQSNGKVRILFKKERFIINRGNDGITWTTYPNYWGGNTGSPWWKHDNLLCDDVNGIINCRNYSHIADGSVNATGSVITYTTNSIMEYPTAKKTKTFETGRVEKGAKSDQDFTYDYTNFDNIASYTFDWTILPEYKKPVLKEDIISYCSSCGRRKRDKERYCPSCGNKL